MLSTYPPPPTLTFYRKDVCSRTGLPGAVQTLLLFPPVGTRGVITVPLLPMLASLCMCQFHAWKLKRGEGSPVQTAWNLCDMEVMLFNMPCK